MRHYYVRCITDYCSAAAAAGDADVTDDVMVAMETEAAVCQTLDAYSELCVARHAAFSWRTASLCRMLMLPIPCPPISQHGVCSVITARNFIPVKRDD